MSTKGLQTKTARKWLATLALEPIDRLERDQSWRNGKSWTNNSRSGSDDPLNASGKPDRGDHRHDPRRGAFSSLPWHAGLVPLTAFPCRELANYWV